MKYPFEASESEVIAEPEKFVGSVFSSLASEFLVMPKSEGYLEYAAFEAGYEALKRATNGFECLRPDVVFTAILESPVSLIVLRAMLGFTPPEWAYLAGLRTGIVVPQNAARSLDREVRQVKHLPMRLSETNRARVVALVETACALLEEGCPLVAEDKLHRLHKADTDDGLTSIRNLTTMGAPYAMLLYERFLGRPFAGHRDSVSDLIGDNLESAIEEVLARAGISFRKTRRAERLVASIKPLISLSRMSSHRRSSLRPRSPKTTGQRATRSLESFASAKWPKTAKPKASRLIKSSRALLAAGSVCDVRTCDS